MNHHHTLLGDLLLRHRIKDIPRLFIVKVLEQQVRGNSTADTCLLLGGFHGTRGRATGGGGGMVTGGEGFSGDGGSAGEIIVWGEVGCRVGVLA